jgi:hypothetical protein
MVQPTKPRREYIIEDQISFRAKWSETHLVYENDMNTLTLIPVKETKIIVLVVDKNTGLVQLRFDKPGATHPHSSGARSTAAEYFQSFRDQVGTMLGTNLQPVELRPGLDKVVNLVPRVVECRSLEMSTEDNFTIKVTPKLRGKDVRDAKDMNAMNAHGTKIKVREVEDLTWFPELSGKAISRKIKTHVDGREGFVRLEADYHESEVNYVIGRLL